MHVGNPQEKRAYRGGDCSASVRAEMPAGPFLLLAEAKLNGHQPKSTCSNRFLQVWSAGYAVVPTLPFSIVTCDEKELVAEACNDEGRQQLR